MIAALWHRRRAAVLGFQGKQTAGRAARRGLSMQAAGLGMGQVLVFEMGPREG